MVIPQLIIRGFSAGSYTGGVLGRLARFLPVKWKLQIHLGAIAMPPAFCPAFISSPCTPITA